MGNKDPSFEQIDEYLDNLEKIEMEENLKDDIDPEEKGEPIPEDIVEKAISSLKAENNGRMPEPYEVE